MAPKQIFPFLFLLLFGGLGLQAQPSADRGGNETQPTKVFTSLEEVFQYTSQTSLTLQNQEIQLDQAKKAKLAAALGTLDVTGSLLSAQFTDNTTLGVNLFPAEIFGGEAGTFKEVQMGVRYNTNLTNFADIKLLNPSGWSNLQLAKINIDLTRSNNQLSLKQLQENIAMSYYNVVQLNEQILNLGQQVAVADTLALITRNKYEEGLVNQQEVNDSYINQLNLEENLSQLGYMREQAYLSLKILCDIPETDIIDIQAGLEPTPALYGPRVELNELNLQHAIFQEKYADASYKGAKAAFMPSLSLQLSNSNNLYNTEFSPFSGNWINSNYIGVNLNVPIPSANRISQTYNAKFEHQMAMNQTEQARMQAKLDQETLKSEYEQAVSQVETDRKVVDLRTDSFQRNQYLYREGIIGLDVVLNSFTAMVNAQYSLISAQANVQLTLSNINIHNQIR
ncbi:MAG: TolC family protein [Bacteroidota bacterium]